MHTLRNLMGILARRRQARTAGLVAVLVVAVYGGSSSRAADRALSSSAASMTNVGLILAGPKNDRSANQEAYVATKAMATKLGVKLSVSESVPPANSAQTARSMVQYGDQIVGAMGAEFQKPLEQLAPTLPNAKFIVSFGGPEKVKNVEAVTFDPYDISYVDGVAAALMSKTGKIGIISGEDSQVFDQIVSGVRQGAKSVNKHATVKVVFSGSYSDAQKNQQATQTLIDAGYDVFMGYLDAGIVVMAKTAQNQHKYVVGLVDDNSSIAPKAVITSGVTDIGKILAGEIAKAENGHFIGGRQVVLGLKQGYGHMGKFGSFVPKSVKAKILKAEAGVASGKIKVNKKG